MGQRANFESITQVLLSGQLYRGYYQIKLKWVGGKMDIQNILQSSEFP